MLDGFERCGDEMTKGSSNERAKLPLKDNGSSGHCTVEQLEQVQKLSSWPAPCHKSLSGHRSPGGVDRHNSECFSNSTKPDASQQWKLSHRCSLVKSVRK